MTELVGMTKLTGMTVVASIDGIGYGGGEALHKQKPHKSPKKSSLTLQDLLYK